MASYAFKLAYTLPVLKLNELKEKGILPLIVVESILQFASVAATF